MIDLKVMVESSMASNMSSVKSKLRILELYSGIGGMHWALKESGVPFEVIKAMDINTTANRIYRHNFPDIDVCTTRIENLSKTQLEGWNIDVILMSPPCQPFTRVGKKQDHEDRRTQSFLHLLGLLRSLSEKPHYLLVENVKGFEVSETRRLLLEVLKDCDYSFQEFLLSPLQFGIPNARLRYYLIAKQGLASFGFPTSAKIMATVPEEALTWLCYQQNHVAEVKSHSCSNSCHKTLSSIPSCNESAFSKQPEKMCSRQFNSCMKGLVGAAECETEKMHSVDDETERTHSRQINSSMGEVEDLVLADAGRNMRHCEEDDPLCCRHGTQLKTFLEYMEEDSFQPFMLSDKELKMFVVMDIVQPSLKKTSCFTKRYGHYVEGAGSLLQMTTDIEAVKKASDFKSLAVEKKNRDQWAETELSILRSLKLRYFTPREVANLLCFPQEFLFPPELNAVQKYRVLGNSLNVHVVSVLIRLMLLET